MLQQIHYADTESVLRLARPGARAHGRPEFVSGCPFSFRSVRYPHQAFALAPWGLSTNQE